MRAEAGGGWAAWGGATGIDMPQLPVNALRADPERALARRDGMRG